MNSLRAKLTIYLTKKGFISLFLLQEVIILAKYSNFAYIFLKKLVKILLKSIKVNHHIIKFEKNP